MSKNGKKVLAALMCALICGSSQSFANGISNIKTENDNIGMISARLGPNAPKPNKITSNQNIARTKAPVPIGVNQSIDIKLKLANANSQSEVITVFRRVRLGMKMGYLPMRVWVVKQLLRPNNAGYFQNVEVQSDGMSKVDITLPNRVRNTVYVKTGVISSKLEQR